MTSLERQLKRLKTPQTEQFRQVKYKPSFLYNRKDAAAIDCDTHLRIANKGLRQLVNECPMIEQFQHLLADESKELDRTVLNEEENDQLSKDLRKLINCSIVPFFMLNCCHEVLEYLVYKYQIQTFQPDDLLCALLPYHETRLFARAIQLFSPADWDSNLWDWLTPYHRDGLPFPKERIASVLAKKTSLVSLLGEKLIEINRQTDLAGKYTSFYTTTMIAVMGRDLSDKFLVSFTPHLYRAIKCASNVDLFMASLALVGYLAFTHDLDAQFSARLLKRLSKSRDKLLSKHEESESLILTNYNKVFNALKKSEAV